MLLTKSGRIRRTGRVTCMGEEKIVYMVLMGKPEGKKSFVRRRRGWADNIKMELNEIGRGLVLD